MNLEIALNKSKIIISLLALVVGLILILSPPASLSTSESIVAALVVIVLTFWVTGIIPEHLTALLFFAVAMIFSITPAHVAFAGFSSAAFWLVFAGMVIGVGINTTGLGKRVAGRVALHLSGNYFQLISGLVFIGVIFAFLMPSAMGRIILLVPIALSVTQTFGFKKGSNGYIGVVLAVVLGAFAPAFAILPANVANMILSGMTESLYQYAPLYGEYLLLHFPVLGFLKALVIIALILWLYPDTPKLIIPETNEENDRITRKELLLSVVLLVLIIFWVTDFIHHVSPAWVALAGAIFLLMPKVAIVTKQQLSEKMNYNSLLFVGGVLGLGSIISYSGLGNSLAKLLIDYFPLNPNTPFINYMSLSVSSMLTGIVTTLPGVPAVLTPLAGELAQASGLTIESVVMTQVLGFSVTLFPYQAPPILIGMQLAGVRMSVALKVSVYLSLISVLFLLPLNYWWWLLLGWI